MENVSSANQSLDSFIYDNTRGTEKAVGNNISYATKSETIDEAAANLTRDSEGWAPIKHTLAGEITHLTYRFQEGDGGQKEKLNDASQTTYRESLDRASKIANVDFREVSSKDHADISVIVNHAEKIAAGRSGYPSDTGLSTAYSYQGNTSDYAHNLFSHELGHSLGLAHPGNYNAGGTSVSSVTSYLEDTNDYSIMSYREPSNPTGNNSGWSPGFQIDDIAALQKLYGANTHTRSGDTVYGFNSNSDDKSLTFTDNLTQFKGAFTIWDGGGNDTLDFSHFTQNQRIDLQDGALSDVGGGKHNVGIAQHAIIENAIGGSGNDIIIGNDAANEIHGGAGNDIIYGADGADQLWGGSGSDTFVYRDLTDSPPETSDTIHDFISGQDKIDVSSILKTFGEMQLNFGNTFSGGQGDTVLNYNQANNTGSVAIDFQGTGHADFQVSLVGQVQATDLIVA